MKRKVIAFLSLSYSLGIGYAQEHSPKKGQKNSPEEKPNILFILTDDQRWDALGFAGNSIIHTPELDRLASEGTYFKNAFVTSPVCAASRASIVTGMYERTHDFTFGTPPLKQEYIETTYPKILKENGYQTGLIGKFGMRFENQQDSTLFDYDVRPGEQFWAITYFRLSSDHRTHRHLSTEIGDLTLDFIDQYAQKEPFCLSVHFHAPHAEDVDPKQYIYPQAVDSLYKDICIPDPILGQLRDFEAQPEWVRQGLNKSRWEWRFNTKEKYQEMVKGYYRMISGVDIEIGRIRAKLEEAGIADNTIIIFMGDNGYFLGERQLAGKWLLYENSLRVPLIVYDPRKKGGEIIEEMALNIDIAPTLLTYAGITSPTAYQGQTLTTLMEGKKKDWRESFFCEHLFESNKIPKSEGIRTTKWKYFRYVDHPEWEELYDLEKDPYETINLAKQKQHEPILKELRKKLEKNIVH